MNISLLLRMLKCGKEVPKNHKIIVSQFINHPILSF